MRRAMAWLAVGLLASLTATAGGQPVGPKRAEPVNGATRPEPPADQTALLFFEVSNPTDRPAEDVQLLAVLPASNPYQQVHHLLTHPPADQKSTDALGQTRAMWNLGRLAPGQAATVMVLVQATLKTVQIDRPAAPAQADKLSPADRLNYLRDYPSWVRLPQVTQAARDWLAQPSKDSRERARQVFDALRRNCQYVLDNKRDSAIDVLTARKGSCTELSFAFVALCRAHDISARMVSAWCHRGQAGPSVDVINHRWAEFWDDRQGWAPADLSRAIRHADQQPLTYRPELYFEHMPARYLTVRDDGVVRPGGADWSGLTVRASRGRVREERFSAWQPTGDAQAERKRFAEVAARIDKASPAELLALLDQWAPGDQPLMRHLTLPLLNHPVAEVRERAATKLADGPDPTVAGVLLMRGALSPDEGIRASLVGQVARMLKRGDAGFRATVVTQIGLCRLAETRALAEEAACGDRDVRVRAAARIAVERIDKAAPASQPDAMGPDN